MPFIGDTGQLSNIYEKNYETATLRIVEGDTAFQAYNPADSHYKLITNLQEISEIGAVTDRTIQFTNVTTSFTTTSNAGISNTNPVHTLDIGSNVQIDDVGSNTFWTSGTVYATNYVGETATVTNSVTTRDVLIDRVFPKTNGFVQMTSNVGILNTAPIHTLDIGANVQIDEYGSNTFWTSGNVYSEHFKSSNVTVSGTVDTDKITVNDINSKDTDFVNFTSNVGILNTAPIHTLDIGANVQIDEYGSNTFWTSGNVHANLYTGSEIQLSGVIRATDFILTGGSEATPTPDLQTISEVLASGGGVPFSSDRTLTLSNVTTALDASVIQSITTKSNVIGNNVTAVTVNSNLIGNNVTAVTVNSNLIGNNVSASFISGNGDLIFRKYTIAGAGSGEYSVIGPGFDTATVNPTLTLMRGQKYVFDNTAHHSFHPLEIRDGYQGSAYTSGVIGGGTATITFTVPMNAPLKLYYQCTYHPAMGNTIYIPLENLDTSQTLNLSNDLVVGTDKLVVDVSESRVGINNASPSKDLDVTGEIVCSSHLTVGGNLTVNGTTTTVNTTSLRVEDTLIELGKNNTAGTSDLGLILKRPTGVGLKSNVAIVYSESVDTLKFGHTLSGSDATPVVFDTSNALAMSLNGSFVATGNVGIGTDSPGYALDVHGTSNVGALTATSLSGDGSGLTSLDAGNISSGTIDKDRLPTTLNNTTIGSLAVGTNDVTLTAKADYHGLKIIKAIDSPNEPATLLLAGDGDPGDDIAFEIRGNGTGADVDTTTTRDSDDTTFGILHTGHTYIGYPNLNPGETGGNAQNGDPMLNVSGDIYATGNVGIGTASPGYKLDVHGTSNVGALTATSLSGDGSGLSALNASNVSSGILTRPISTTTGTFSGDVEVTGELTTKSNVFLGVMEGFAREGTLEFGRADGTDRVHNIKVYNSSTQTDNYMKFQIHAGGASAGTVTDNVLYLRGDGNVGIGTTNPGYKLDVHGTANVGALTATSVSGPLSGNADTATALETARAINGVNFDGSVDITVNGTNYDVNDSWLRENGDDAHFKQYGNSRQMVFRTDGTTQYASDVGAYPFVWMYGGDDASSNRRMLLNTSGQLWCSNYGWLHDKFMARTQTFTDDVANTTFTGQTIDHNCSGSDACTADRAHRALLIDVDSSATGGGTNHEHRLYGIYNDVRHTGDSDLVYGMYSYTRSDHASGTTTNLKAGDFIAIASGAGTNTNIYGLSAYALKDSGSPGTTANMYGVRGEVEVDAGTCTNAYAFQSHIDRDSGTITTGYLYYGSYSGTVGTKYGVYVTGETKNYFSGNVGIGLTGITEKLHVSGNILATGDVTAYSDKRVKTDISKIKDPLNKVCSINGYTYKRTDTDDDKTHTGVLAQEVMEVLPEVVHGSEDTTYSVAYGNMVGLLIEAIKELKLEIDELKKSR